MKFHQLKSKLKGQALDTIRGYQMMGNNYAAAWDDLKRRYDRTDNLIQEYIRKFLEVPAIMNKANLPRLRAIVDATNQMTRALPNLGADVHHWDPFICLIITSKLDEETRTEWKQHIGRRMNATIGELIEFLETRAIDYQPSEGDRLSQMLRGNPNQRNLNQRNPNPRRNIFVVNERGAQTEKPKGKKTCIVCQGDHFPWTCEALKNECAKVRTAMIKSFGGCFKCLLKHKIGQCNKGNCPYCGGKHNLMLCYKKENNEKEKLARASTANQANLPSQVGRSNQANLPNRVNRSTRTNLPNRVNRSNQQNVPKPRNYIPAGAEDDWNVEGDQSTKK